MTKDYYRELVQELLFSLNKGDTGHVVARVDYAINQVNLLIERGVISPLKNEEQIDDKN